MQTEISYPTVSEWLTTLDQQYQRYKRAGFEFIFLLRDGIDALPRNDNERAALYHDVSDQVGLTVHTLRNYVSSARKPCAALAQELSLEIGHLDAVAGLDDEMAEDALRLAGEQRWTVSQLRAHVFKQKNTVPDIGKTPTADAIDRDLAGDDEPPYADDKQYDCTLPDAYDSDAFIAIPREPVAAARMLLREFDAGQIAALVAELVR